MISPLLCSFSSSFLALCLIFVPLSAQTVGPPPENLRRPADDSIAGLAQEQGTTILYFPDFVDGGGWSLQLVLSNVDPGAAAEVRVAVYDPNAQPVLDLFDSDVTLKIPSLGSQVLKSSGSGAIRQGWIQVETESATVSGLLTYRHAESGIEVGVEPVHLGTEFALFVEESTRVGAGFAVLKPDAASRLELRIRDEEGSDPLNGGFVLGGISTRRRARSRNGSPWKESIRGSWRIFAATCSCEARTILPSLRSGCSSGSGSLHSRRCRRFGFRTQELSNVAIPPHRRWRGCPPVR